MAETKLFPQAMLSLPQGVMYNGKIVPSVTSNNLTVAIKTYAGTDPSANDPVFIKIGDIVRQITGALSVTINAGANNFNAGSAELATKEIDYFTYLFWNTATSAVSILVSRLPYGNVYGDFNATPTNEKALSVNAGGNTTDAVELIGRFAATLSAGAGYTWSVPTFTTANLIQRPIYETRLLIWAPTVTGVTGASFGTSGYYIKGNRMTIICQALDATSNATTKTLVLPMVSSASQYPIYGSGIFPCKDGGAHQTVMAHASITASSSTLTLYKTWYQGAWTGSGAWSVFIHELTYQV